MPHLVQVRFFDEVHPVTNFITPFHPSVQDLAFQLGTLGACYAWVTRNVEYPANDKHSIEAFGGGLFTPAKFRQTVWEFWHTPAETLGWGNHNGQYAGDCDDSSILLASLAKALGYNVQVGIGTLGGYGHAWCRLDGQVMESTLSEPAPLRPETSPYELEGYFDDKESVEISPGIYSRLGEESRKLEREKSAILGRLYGVRAKP